MAATRGLRQPYQDCRKAWRHGRPIDGSRFHQTLRGWMAAPRAATFHVGSAAAVL